MLCGRARVVAFGAHRPVSRVLAAGIIWTYRTNNAEWSHPFGRDGHTSVVDAAGAIYVIGGGDFLDDVWASTDGGARAGLAQGVVGGVLGGYSGGTTGVLRGY